MENEYRLPKDFAIKWLEHLRSGDYNQTRAALHANGGYCCLGVACLVAGITEEEMGDSGYMITGMVQQIGKPYPSELLGCTPLGEKLMQLNDQEKRTFLEIADWVEENVEFY